MDLSFLDVSILTGSLDQMVLALTMSVATDINDD
jgi:hypothetical protein